MPSKNPSGDVCSVCGLPAGHRLRILIDDKSLRIWYLCPIHAQIIAARDYAIQLEPEYGGKWLWADEKVVTERAPLG